MNAYFKRLGLRPKPKSQPFDAWCGVVQRAHEAVGGMDEELQVAVAVLTDEAAYEWYVRLHCSKTYYDIFGVPTSCGNDVIKKEYRKLVVKLHPDKRKSENKFLAAQIHRDYLRLQNAWETLRDSRAEYDAASEKCKYDWSAQQCPSEEEWHFDFQDPEWVPSGSECEEAPSDYEERSEESECEEWQSRGQPGAKAKKPRAKTPRAKTPRAKTPRAKTPRAKTPRAKTPRAKKPSPEPRTRKKRKREHENDTRGFTQASGAREPQRVTITLPLSDIYAGKVVRASYPRGVRDLDGKWVNQELDVAIPVPARCAPGHFGTQTGLGQYDAESGSCADVHFILSMSHASGYEVCGLDLIVQVTVPLREALVGGEYVVELPNREKRTFTYSSPLKHGQEVRHPHMGLINPQNKQDVGGLVCRINVEYPGLSTRQRQATAAFFAAVWSTDVPRAQNMMARVLATAEGSVWF
jgi:DnaJ-class molecular chaperone